MEYIVRNVALIVPLSCEEIGGFHFHVKNIKIHDSLFDVNNIESFSSSLQIHGHPHNVIQSPHKLMYSLLSDIHHTSCRKVAFYGNVCLIINVNVPVELFHSFAFLVPHSIVIYVLNHRFLPVYVPFAPIAAWVAS